MAVEPESENTWVIWYQEGPRSFKRVEKVMLYINWHFTSDSQLHPNHTSHQEQSCRTGGANFARHYSRCRKSRLGGSLHMIIGDALMAVHTIWWTLDGKDIWEASSNCRRAHKKNPPKHFPDHPYNTDLIKKGRCYLPLQASSRKQIVAIHLFTWRIYCIEFNIANLKTVS